MLSQKFINDMNKIISETNSDLSFGDGVDWFDEEVDTSSFLQAPLFNYQQEQELVERQPNIKKRKSRQPRGYWDEEENIWKRWNPKKSSWWYNYVVQMLLKIVVTDLYPQERQAISVGPRETNY